MHELTHLQTNFGISAPALIACILGCCILCLWKAENISHSQALHRSTVRQEEGEGVPKAAAEARRGCGFWLGEREETVPLSPNVSGTLFVIHLYWSTRGGTSWGTMTLLLLCQPSHCFHHPQSKRRIQSSPFPWGFPSALRHLPGEEKLSAAWEWWWV